MASGGSDRRRRKGKGTQLKSPTAGHSPPHMGPPPTFPPQSTSLPPTFFMPPPGPVHISVSSVGTNSGSNLNFIPTPNVTSSPGFHISQQGTFSAVPTSSTPAASPPSSTPSVSMLNIGVSDTPTSPSIGSATAVASRGRRGKEILQFDTYSRLIIVPDKQDGLFPPHTAAHMVTESMKPLYDEAWGRWKDIPYHTRDRMWNQFKEKLKGGPVSYAEVFAETHKKRKRDGSREGWVETRASEQYDGYHKSLEEWCQTQPASDDGTPIQPSPDVMTSIWTDVAGGVSKGRVYGLGVQRPSSFRPSPLVSDAPTEQNQEKVGALENQMELLSKRCKTAEAHIARMDRYMKKHMPNFYDDDETESDA